jgi:CHASE1-domain containing sensor protein
VPGFEIREIDAAGQRRRAKERDRYYPVTYVEPLAGNEHIVGFDLFSEAGRKAAVEETIKTERVTQHRQSASSKNREISPVSWRSML